ncbi:MAG: hypothetical protein K6B72_10110, partial [Lachnospiraceae bacterium]|nr:hypothetical protein [Lachnospiraceae bacterium]
MSAKRMRRIPRRRSVRKDNGQAGKPREAGSSPGSGATVRPRSVKRGLTRRRPRPSPEPEGSWNEVVYHRESMNMDDPADRREFVSACLQQITEAQLEMDNLEYEYRTVTAYLRDLEEIDALPKGQRQEVARLAQRILDAGRGREQFFNREEKMSESDFERIQALGSKTQETIQRLSQAEDYQKKVKNDLRRLDNERNSYDYRLDELERTISSVHALMIFVAVLLVAVVILLFILSRILNWNVRYGWLLAILFAAIGATMLYLRGQ